jgi:hemoglobin-like flavoprotein
VSRRGTGRDPNTKTTGAQMQADAELLKQNFETLVEHEHALVDSVYAELFRRHPELLALFSAPRSPAGAQMVRETLMYAIDHLDGASWVQTNLASLGAKHVDYDVTEEMYTWVVDAMLHAMSAVSGAQWSHELETSWRELLEYLSDLMIAELPT